MIAGFFLKTDAAILYKHVQIITIIIGRLKLSPILKILVVFKESLRYLKCLHSLFEYCRPYRLLASDNVTTASEDVRENHIL